MSDGSGNNASNGSGSNVSDGSGGDASNGEQWGVADEALLAHPPLTSYCATQFLTGRDWYWSMAWGLGTPAID